MTRIQSPRPTLAVLCAALLALACGDTPGEIAGPGDPLFAKKDCSIDPSHPACKDDGGGDDGSGGGNVLAGLSGAMTTPEDRVMTGVSDNNKSLSMNTDGWGPMAFAFDDAAAAYGNGECRTEGDGDFDSLAAWLTGDADLGGFEMKYDKTADGESSDGHAVVANLDGGINIGLFAHAEPPPTATAGANPETYTYAGAWVRVWFKEGPPPTHLKLFCPAGGDAVTVTVTR